MKLRERLVRLIAIAATLGLTGAASATLCVQELNSPRPAPAKRADRDTAQTPEPKAAEPRAETQETKAATPSAQSEQSATLTPGEYTVDVNFPVAQITGKAKLTVTKHALAPFGGYRFTLSQGDKTVSGWIFGHS